VKSLAVIINCSAINEPRENLNEEQADTLPGGGGVEAAEIAR